MFIFALVVTSATALAAALFLTPVVRRVAIEYGFVDRPDGRRKMQKAPVGLGGGAAVLLALLIGVLLLSGLWLAQDFDEIVSLSPVGGLRSEEHKSGLQ